MPSVRYEMPSTASPCPARSITKHHVGLVCLLLGPTSFPFSFTLPMGLDLPGERLSAETPSFP